MGAAPSAWVGQGYMPATPLNGCPPKCRYRDAAE